MSILNKYQRGQIWMHKDVNTSLDSPKENGERGLLKGSRPMLIISSVSNPSATCQVLAIPLTTANNQKASPDFMQKFHYVEVDTGRDVPSYIACTQVQPIVTNHLHTYLGSVPDEIMKKVEDTVLEYLQITPLKATKEPKPVVEPSVRRDLKYFPASMAVACAETERVYRSANECAKALQLATSTLSAKLRKSAIVYYKGYHIFSVAGMATIAITSDTSSSTKVPEDLLKLEEDDAEN